jgi:hypothetical protein
MNYRNLDNFNNHSRNHYHMFMDQNTEYLVKDHNMFKAHNSLQILINNITFNNRDNNSLKIFLINNKLINKDNNKYKLHLKEEERNKHLNKQKELKLLINHIKQT